MKALFGVLELVELIAILLAVFTILTGSGIGLFLLIRVLLS